MAKPEDIKKKARETAEIVEDALRSIASQVGQIFDDALISTDDFSKSLENDVAKGLNSLAKTSTLIETNLSKLNKGNLTRLDIEKQIEQRQIKFNSLQTQLNIAVKSELVDEEEANKLLAEAIGYEKELTKELEDQANQADKINGKLGNTGKILKGFTKIPILGQLIDSEKVLAKVQAESAKEGSTKTSVFKAGLKETGKTIKDSLFDPTVLVGGAFTILVKTAKFFWDALLGASTQIAKFRRDFGLTAEEAEAVRQRTYSIANASKIYADTQGSILITQAQVVKSLNDINNALETQIDLTQDLGEFGKQALIQDAILRDNLQLDEETRSNILKETLRTGKTQEQITKSTLGSVYAVGMQRNIMLDNNKILSTAAKTTGELRSSFHGSTEEIAKGVAKLQLMGLTLEDTKKIAGSLLDFESSISNELEAELLTGKNLNLERARAYALNRDYVNLGKEIIKQGLTSTELNKMNAFQLEAQAKVFGLNGDELVNMVQKQEEFNALSDRAAKAGVNLKDVEKKGLKGIYDDLKKQQASEETIKSILGDRLYTQKLAESAQEKFNKALDKAKESFERLVSSGVLDKLVDAITKFVNLLSGGQAAADKAADLEKQRKEALEQGDNERVKEIDKLISKAKSEAESGGKTSGAVKGAEMGIAAAIGGLALGTILDLTGIGAAAGIPLQAASLGTLATALGASTAVGAGIGYATSGAPTPTSINSQPTQQDFIVKSMPQDTVVGMGGTKLGRTDEMVQLLTEQNRILTALLTKEGTITLNGTKMGTAMAVGSYKVQ
jgi:hypothetical protein